MRRANRRLALRQHHQAKYVLVRFAQANLAKIPDDLRDDQVVLLSDIASTRISAAESAEVQIGDTVAVFAQGPIGLCAIAGAKLKGASLIIGVESDPVRSEVAKRLGADAVVKRLTGEKGVDVSIEALGTQATFEWPVRRHRSLAPTRRQPPGVSPPRPFENAHAE